MAWTSEMDARLKELYNQGHSCATIGAMMGKTRNAIIGRVHRISLPRRAQSYRKKSISLAPKQPRVAAINSVNRPVRITSAIFESCEPLPPASAYDVARVSFDDLELHHCRFPVGEPAAAGTDKPLFCGMPPAARGIPYCEVHTRRAYQAPAPRRHVHISDPDSNVVELKRERAPA